MGDAADDLTDAGYDAWGAHLRDECDASCPYCREEDEGVVDMEDDDGYGDDDEL